MWLSSNNNGGGGKQRRGRHNWQQQQHQQQQQQQQQAPELPVYSTALLQRLAAMPQADFAARCPPDAARLTASAVGGTVQLQALRKTLHVGGRCVAMARCCCLVVAGLGRFRRQAATAMHRSFHDVLPALPCPTGISSCGEASRSRPGLSMGSARGRAQCRCDKASRLPALQMHAGIVGALAEHAAGLVACSLPGSFLRLLVFARAAACKLFGNHLPACYLPAACRMPLSVQCCLPSRLTRTPW